MLLGLDVGTSSAKALLLDRRGQVVAEAGAPYPVEHPQPGWAETDPEAWWSAVVAAVRALPAPARGAVRALGLSGQMHGAVLCDGEGRSLRPAILWTDGRAAGLLHRFPAEAARRAGNAATAGMTGPTLLWLSEHEPGLLGAARWALLAKDWLRLRLTGEAATDPSDATGTSLSDHQGEWDQPLLQELGLRRELLPPVRPAGAESGRLRPWAAEALGLPPGLLVATGAGDTLAAALGTGLLREGEAQLAIGSSAQIVVPRGRWSGFTPSLNLYRSALPAGLPGWCQMAAMLNGGLALDWARARLGLGWDEAYARAFAEGAERGQVVFLPWLTGERTPFMDPRLRAAWVGLDAGDDAGVLMRAAFQGVACAIRAGLEALREQGAEVARLRLSGGGAARPAFRQLLADVLGLPLEEVTGPSASARGAALLGGLAAGLIAPGDLPGLSPAPVPVAEPRPGTNGRGYARFRDLHQRLAGWFEP
jgi:sugar (pentulose or hexulose) kinase